MVCLIEKCGETFCFFVFFGLPDSEFLRQTQECVRHFPNSDTHTRKRARARAHTNTHTCTRVSFCWLCALKLLQCTPALLMLQCLMG